MAWGRGRQPQASRPPRALIAPGTRLALAGVALLCAAVVTALGVRYAGHTAAGPLDASVDHWVQARLGLTSVPLTVLTWLGDEAAVTLITIAATLACLLARWWRGAALALLAAPVAALSMPSGHTTAVFTLATLAAVLLIRPGDRVRYLIVAAAYLLATAVAVAMIAQNFHYFTDVISGAAVGVGTVLTGALAIDALAPPVWARARRAAGMHPGTSPGPN